MIDSVILYVKRGIQFYSQNVALVLFFIITNGFVLFMAASIPYLNWFLDVLPVLLALLDWVVILFVFRLSGLTIFRLFCLITGVTLFITLIGVERAATKFGIVMFGLIGTLIVQKIYEFKQTQK